jgi:hypothetical protein
MASNSQWKAPQSRNAVAAGSQRDVWWDSSEWSAPQSRTNEWWRANDGGSSGWQADCPPQSRNDEGWRINDEVPPQSRNDEGRQAKDGGEAQSTEEFCRKINSERQSFYVPEKTQSASLSEDFQIGHMEASRAAAVAETQAAGAAAATGSNGFDKKFFDDFRGFTDTYQQHNAAGKYFRYLLTEENWPDLDFDGNSAVAVCHIVHEDKSPAFKIDESEQRAWNWLELVAQLDGPSRAKVFGQSSALLSCSFAFRDGKVATGLPVWDFIIHRADGTAIGLHPEWAKTKIPSRELNAPSEEPEQRPNPAAVAAKGKARPTFKVYRNCLGNLTLRFDPNRRPNPAAVAEAAAAVAEGTLPKPQPQSR